MKRAILLGFMWSLMLSVAAGDVRSVENRGRLPALKPLPTCGQDLVWKAMRVRAAYVSPTVGPVALFERTKAAYESMRISSYAALFTADFRFFAADPDVAARCPGGMTREDEIASARNLFQGFVRSDGTSMPAAKRITLDFGPLEVRSDPAHPDSIDHYAIVVAHGLCLVAEFSEHRVVADFDDHEFHVVRGDAAILSDPSDLRRWYFRAWIERDALLATRGDTLQEPATRHGDAESPPPLRLGPLPTPLTGPLDVRFTLASARPASLELFDAAGRRVLRRVMEQGGEGPHRLELDREGQLAPGVYWLRLTQESGATTAKIVVLR